MLRYMSDYIIKVLTRLVFSLGLMNFFPSPSPKLVVTLLSVDARVPDDVAESYTSSFSLFFFFFFFFWLPQMKQTQARPPTNWLSALK